MFSVQIKIVLFFNQEINVYFHWLLDWLILVIMIKSLFVIEIEEDMFQHWRVQAIAPVFNFSISRLSGTDRLSEMRICNVAARSTSDLITIRGWPGNRPIFMQRRNILLWTCQIYHKAWYIIWRIAGCTSRVPKCLKLNPYMLSGMFNILSGQKLAVRKGKFFREKKKKMDFLLLSKYGLHWNDIGRTWTPNRWHKVDYEPG